MTFSYYIPSRDLVSLSFYHLIHSWPLEFQFSLCNAQYHITMHVDAQFPGTSQIEPDGLRVRSGCNDEVVFQLVLVPVKNEVYAGINVGILHPGIGRHVDVPLLGVIPDEVIRALHQLVRSTDPRRWICTFEAHADCRHCSYSGS